MLDWYDLNARHEATILWIAATLFIAIACSAGVRRSAHGLLRMLREPAISLLIVGLLANVALLTFVATALGRKVGLWETVPVMTSIVWASTTGFSLLLHLGEFLKREDAFKRRVVSLLGPSTVIAGVVGVSILSFWWELLLVPILSALVYAVYASRSAVVTIIASAALVAYAVGLVVGVVIDLTSDPGTWRSPTQAIILPMVFIVGTLPYVQLLVLVERFRFSMGTRSRTVRSSDYGEDWPLTVDSARLCCWFQAVWVEVNGKKYALNGTAGPILKKFGYPSFELNVIWRDHPCREKLVEGLEADGEAAEWKVSIHRLIEDGLAMGRRS